MLLVHAPALALTSPILAVIFQGLREIRRAIGLLYTGRPRLHADCRQCPLPRASLPRQTAPIAKTLSRNAIHSTSLGCRNSALSMRPWRIAESRRPQSLRSRSTAWLQAMGGVASASVADRAAPSTDPGGAA